MGESFKEFTSILICENEINDSNVAHEFNDSYYKRYIIFHVYFNFQASHNKIDDVCINDYLVTNIENEVLGSSVLNEVIM